MDLGDDSQWTVTLREVECPSEVAERWRTLETRSHCSFFQSWAWLGPWLDNIGSQADIRLLEARYRDSTVGLGLLGLRARRTPGFGSSPCLLVSETGVATYDDLTIEHNGFLVERGCEKEALKRCLDFLFRSGDHCDELVIGGLEAGRADVYATVAGEWGLYSRVLSAHPYFRVGLADLRRREAAYLSSLSANTRHQIRRALREYARRGPVTLEVATTQDEGQAFFERLKELHQGRWSARGERGAFAHDSVLRFHQHLIECGLPGGRVQLLRASAGSTPFAYLYNFVFNGVVYNYQGGFVYEDDHKLKPGLVAHALAVRYNLELGHDQYDLLMGDQRYKRSLGGEQGAIARLAIQRRRPGWVMDRGRRMLGRAARKMNPLGRSEWDE